MNNDLYPPYGTGTVRYRTLPYCTVPYRSVPYLTANPTVNPYYPTVNPYYYELLTKYSTVRTV